MTNKRQDTLLVIAGEASGDLHGALLIKAIQSLQQQATNHLNHLNFIGIGGPKMREAGVKLLMNAEALSVVGAIEVIPKLYTLLRAKRLIKKQFHAKSKPRLVILIDYPGFNLHIAKMAKQAGIPVVYYISPQIWAWRKHRIKTIKKWVDHMIVIFPFEVSLYQHAGVPVTFVGHPLTTEAVCPLTPTQARTHLALSPINHPVIGLMPGSRLQEIKCLLPEMLKAADLLKKTQPTAQFMVILAPHLNQAVINPYLSHYPHLPIKITREAYTAIRAADLMIAASGTATLEIGLLETPMIILYKLSSLSYYIAKHLAYLSDISLCNIILGRRVCPELLQHQACAKNIVKEALSLLKDTALRQQTLQALQSLKPQLHRGNAASNAAQVVLDYLTLPQ